MGQTRPHDYSTAQIGHAPECNQLSESPRDMESACEEVVHCPIQRNARFSPRVCFTAKGGTASNAQTGSYEQEWQGLHGLWAQYVWLTTSADKNGMAGASRRRDLKDGAKVVPDPSDLDHA